MVRTFFYNRHFLKEINKTFITWIPKMDNLEASNPYRPISLCNVCYKIIAKIMANRVKPLLHKIVSTLQGAFAPCKLINDNILLAHQLCTFLKRTKPSLFTWQSILIWKILMIDLSGTSLK